MTTTDADAEFFAKNKGAFPDGWYPDDDEFSSDLILLVVIDEVPVEYINNVLRESEQEMGARAIELADTPDSLPVWKKNAADQGTGSTSSRAWPPNVFDSLPDFDINGMREGTEPNVAATWQSPFLGKRLAYVNSWVAWIPKPPKRINKRFFAVLQKELYERDGKVLICKVRKHNRKNQTIPVLPRDLGRFQVQFRRERWQYCYEDQSLLA